ncbi:roadblock/LC7 domain-containing protein [Pseudomonas sp. CGJS7]|uniref:roadblock/LC7 domain-containing protein n=1 Tax=Pseudomonas sp. CGJS7 TaxID=3109348 RepID=UPI0030094DFF
MQRTTIDMLLGRLHHTSSDEQPARALLNAELDDCKRRLPGLRAICVSTADGRILAERCDDDVDARRVAAMASSFLTLGETLAKEVGLNQASYATACTGLGNLVLFRIAAAKPLTLLAVADQDTVLASLLVAARDCAGRIAAGLAAN